MPSNKLPATPIADTAYPAAPLSLELPEAAALEALADAALALLLAAASVVVADTLSALVTAVPACDRAELRPGSFGLSDAIDERADVTSDWIEARVEALSDA